MFGVINGGGVRACLGLATDVELERVWGSSTRMQLDVSIKRGSGRGIKGRKRSPKCVGACARVHVCVNVCI